MSLVGFKARNHGQQVRKKGRNPGVAKAWDAYYQGATVVMLIPANRTEQVWWQEMVEPYRDRQGSPLRSEFIKGRLRFIARGADGIKPNERPPFGCVLLVWSGHGPAGPETSVSA